MTKFYEMLSTVNVFFYIAESIFFFIGISILAKNSNVTTFISGDYKEFIGSKYTTSSDFGNIGLYIFLLIMGIFLLVIGIYSGYQSRYSYSSDGIAILMCLAGAILVISAHIYFVVVLYRVWEFSINESFRLNLSPSIETPGKAVGYLFIPFFNFYWIFVAYGKLSKDLRAIANTKGVVVTMSAELGVILSIFCILTIIPFVGYFTSVIALVLFPIFLNQAIVQSTIIAEVNHKF
jgi:hypothetical protein